MDLRTRARLLGGAVWVGCFLPLAWVSYRLVTGDLGANPIEEAIHWAGKTALVFLLLTLTVTPLRRLTGWNQVARLRRRLGLTAFWYLTVHFLLYAGLDQGFALEYIVEDVLERPYIAAGFTAFVLLIPLAVTSTKGWIRRLGKRWQKLHRLVYLAAGLGVLHFYWRVKADTFWPLVAAVVLAALLLLRLRWRSSGRASPARDRRKDVPAEAATS